MTLPTIPNNNSQTDPEQNGPLFRSSTWDHDRQLLTINVAPLSGEAVNITLTGWRQGLRITLHFPESVERWENPFAASLFPIEFFEQSILHEWVQTLPLKVLALIKVYAMNPLGYLLIIQQDLAAFELFVDHPLLFTLLFHQAQRKQQGLTWFLLQCRAKRTQLLDVCDLPGKPSAVKLLHRIQIERYSASLREVLIELFSLNYELLNHLEQVPESLVRCLIKHPILLGSCLLHHWHTLESDIEELQSILKDIVRMRRHTFLTDQDWLIPLQQCRKLADVIKLHDRLVVLINREQADGSETFPAPPLTGNAFIQPIICYSELLSEGQQQHHCVASYAEDIRLGKYYVYRVLEPERATLGINVQYFDGKNIRISIDQLKGFANSTVSIDTAQAVTDWFTQQTTVKTQHE